MNSSYGEWLEGARRDTSATSQIVVVATSEQVAEIRRLLREAGVGPGVIVTTADVAANVATSMVAAATDMLHRRQERLAREAADALARSLRTGPWADPVIPPGQRLNARHLDSLRVGYAPRVWTRRRRSAHSASRHRT